MVPLRAARPDLRRVIEKLRSEDARGTTARTCGIRIHVTVS
jgi:hypothetical protein